MSDKRRLIRYFLLDFLSALIAWQFFSVFRFYEVRSTIYYDTAWQFLNNTKAYLMSAGLPCFWCFLYYFTGYYTRPRYKNNVSDLINTLFATILGSLLIFFTIIINDYPDNYTQFYSVFVGLFLIHFFCTLIVRFVQTSSMLNEHAAGKVGVSALIVGCGQEAEEIRRYLSRWKNSSVYLSKGMVRLGNEASVADEQYILGNLEQIGDIIRKHGIESLIVASDNRDSAYIQSIVNQLYQYDLDIHTTIHPEEVLFSDVSLYSVAGVPLRRLTPSGLSAGEKKLKRSVDLVVSSVALVLLSPLFLCLAIRMRADSKGNIFYTQERLGLHGKKFNIIKFRTMRLDAEANGPLLSSVNDERITPFGRVMRKYRLDELPQLINVLKGEMSLVGPRPERQFYARQILEKAPHYQLVYQVKPGITSLGMVKFGYADNVDKMIERFDYDLIYLKNQSVLMDLKILLSTIKPVVLGKGV